MLIAMASLAGIPFTAGFLGKFFIFDAAIRQHQTMLRDRRRDHGRVRLLLLSQSGARDVLGDIRDATNPIAAQRLVARDDGCADGRQSSCFGVYPQPILECAASRSRSQS